LMAVRGIMHAMRGWPTPYGAALSAANLFDASGECLETRDAGQIATVADQVMEFAQMRRAQLQGADR
jgi:FMN reductase